MYASVLTLVVAVALQAPDESERRALLASAALRRFEKTADDDL